MRVAVITGGMGGLGESISVKMHAAGYRVAVTCSPGNKIVDEWLENQKKEGREFKAYQVDVADFDSCQECIARVTKELGPVDVLVNNAGITRDSMFRKMSKENWDAVLRTNLYSVFNMTKQVIEGMLERNWGRIINVSSMNGAKGQFGQSNYAAAKAGMYGFTKSLALEVGRKGVTVNTVSPGYLGTKMVLSVPKEVMDTKILPLIPVGRLGSPEEIADIIAFLASDSAGYITGADIAANGGQYM
ncbi:acetoacetyl-CoA reductase [Rhodoplanes serenus]|jgi:acetoacetyl-CoA reductase|uniref:Acetoacetyl-CoA reductase n=1 Tax=Rhodoplanes serenus TaxID=200615 RepID=A0A327JXC8_9BRAD|nr:acetoacetyl-CoA reductase [Rhodoplanes serenus]MBI5114328.1 acetoacetyl-CoA reductase [Rhodovulum sp.]MTW15633.1 acetoacetyl-CoA reductase [Rhodoplanes serenus]RAI31180.1 beta-ketoacyl-ACP reductase [Rhodoplanes serenus]VCU07908.1 Acetoacetyl-CoA reductase [Rhodoplanes serenus]